MKKSRSIFICFILSFLAISIPGACADPKSAEIREPAVSGRFYPSEPEKLELAVRQYIRDSKALPVGNPKAILVPHAGYIYSGQISADAYRQVMDGGYDTFIILGVNHTTAGFRGISIADYDRYRTPLGDIPIDSTIVSKLLDKCDVCVQSRDVHRSEHSIEVQVPFIQVLFPEAKIVPIIIHPPDPDLCIRFGKTLADVLKNRKALIVISSDLSHYPASADAFEADRKTLEAIAGMDPEKIISVMRDLNVPKLDTRACGEAAILTGVAASVELGVRGAFVVGITDSGKTSIGDRDRAVGYGAIVFTPEISTGHNHILNRRSPPDTATPLQEEEKKSLLEFARKTIRQYLETDTLPLARNFPVRMDFRQGAFVTLKKEGNLRGCIGSILPEDGLARTVGRMALRAAINDPRFRPVKLEELEDLEIEISVLTPLKTVDHPDRIVTGRDGVVLIKDGKSAVFLPQVAPENNWTRTEMLDHLCIKAGLPSKCWEKNARLEIFQADVFGEKQ